MSADIRQPVRRHYASAGRSHRYGYYACFTRQRYGKDAYWLALTHRLAADPKGSPPPPEIQAQPSARRAAGNTSGSSYPSGELI